MRDARAARAQERRRRRDRRLAGRGLTLPATAALLPTALRLAAAVLCAGIALSLWDVGARSPLQSLREAGAAVRHRRALLGGILRFAAGLGYALLALAFVMLALPAGDSTLASLVAIGTFVAGLLFEALVGEPLRNLLGLRRAATDESPPER